MARKPKAEQERVWRDRIVGEGMVPPGDLAPHPLNPRTHPASQARALEGLLQEVGWVQRVVVNKATGRIVDGHLRVEVAKARGEPTVPVVYVDLTEPEEALVLALLDPIAGLAGLNREALATLVAGLEVEDEALAALARTLGGAPAGRGDPDEVPPVPEEAATYVQRGAVYLLGRHRLMCGDATSAEDVARLLAGAKPALMVTDPPYGVEYDPNWRNEAAAKGTLAYAASRVGVVQNDDRSDWSAAWALFTGAVVYCWHAGLHASIVQTSLESVGFEMRSQVIWAKSNYPISRGHYHWRHEPCWYAVRKGSTAGWQGDHKQTTLWEINLDKNVEGGHSTQKPVECMERPIRNHAGDVYEPFSGSGTTLIAAERQQRACYAMEIEPRYVQVAIDRWEAYTGQKATAESGAALRRRAAR